MKQFENLKEIKLLSLEFLLKSKLPVLKRNQSNSSTSFSEISKNNFPYIENNLKLILNNDKPHAESLTNFSNFNDLLSKKKFNNYTLPTNSISKRLNNLYRSTSVKSLFNANNNEKKKMISSGQSKTFHKINNSNINKTSNDNNTFNKLTHNFKTPIKKTKSEIPTLARIIYNDNKQPQSYHFNKTFSSTTIENYLSHLSSIDLKVNIGPNCCGIEIDKLKEIQNETLFNLKFKKSVNLHNLKKLNCSKKIKLV